MDDDALIKELTRDEGLRLKPYTDTVGKLTIGVGRNLSDVGISIAEANAMLLADIRRAEADLDRNLPWWRHLSKKRQRVLTNMCFNMGITRLLKFERMLAAINAGKFEDAALEMLRSKWAGQVGDRAKRLAAMMEEG